MMGGVMVGGLMVRGISAAFKPVPRSIQLDLGVHRARAWGAG